MIKRYYFSNFVYIKGSRGENTFITKNIKFITSSSPKIFEIQKEQLNSLNFSLHAYENKSWGARII